MATLKSRWAAWVVVGVIGCRGRGEPEPPKETGAVRAAPSSPSGEVGRQLDLIEQLSECELRHRGLLLDLGSSAVGGLEGWRLRPDNNSVIEREGATWMRLMSRSISYRFVLDEPQSLFVAVRLKSLVSKSAAVMIDGKKVATLSLTRGQAKVSSSSVLSSPVSAGTHLLTLRFDGHAKEGVDPVAEIDWIRLGIPDEDTSSFAAPTHADVLQNLATTGDTAHRSVALRVPSSLRCQVVVPPGGRLRTSIALVGTGEGEAEVRALVDGKPAQVLRSIKMLGAEKPPWTDLDLPLVAYEGQPVTLELASLGGGRGSRMLWGDPRIVAAGKDARVAPAKAVVIVVVSSVNPERLPPWAPDRPLPTFDALARESAIFERYRVPSITVGGVMGSLLTGLSPRQHGVEDNYARLPERLPLLSSIARDASVHTALMTAHPSTFAAFGFARGWDRFVAHSPVSPALGARPLEDLIGWISEHGNQADKGLLAIAHTRGIHPPYDLSPGEFAQLPPHPDHEYAGPLDPRRAGQVLERFRVRKRGTANHWTEADTMRLNALMDGALAQTDRALSNLIDGLRKAGLWNDTLLMVTSDVAAAADPNVLPFASALDPSEETLRAPLYVHFPGGAQAGQRIQMPATTVDLAWTALVALGLEAAGSPGGEDLFALASRGGGSSERALVASSGERVMVRWGDWRAVAREGVRPWLCDLAHDAKCERDLSEQMPLLTEGMWRKAYLYEAQARPPRFVKPAREPATIDPETAAALSVWGR